MNLIPVLLEVLRVARAQLGVYHHANLDAQKLMLEAEAKALQDYHVVWISHHDENTVVLDCDAYKGPGWYSTDESGVISSGPHTSFVKAAWESGRYVGAEEVEDDGDPFEEKMPRLVAELNQQFLESAKLEAAIRQNLKGLGYAL